MKTPAPSSLLLIGAGIIIPALAARAARSAVGVGYQAVTSDAPPKNPAHPHVDLRDAIIWTAITGALGGLARMGTRRYLAHTSIPAEGLDLAEEFDPDA
ncbi:DUF4235 domain-containing protein [bacterium]|nr:DUF4235 domain-containing protein [bacterium]